MAQRWVMYLFRDLGGLEYRFMELANCSSDFTIFSTAATPDSTAVLASNYHHLELLQIYKPDATFSHILISSTFADLHIASAASKAKPDQKFRLILKLHILPYVYPSPSMHQYRVLTHISPTSLIGRGTTLCAVNLFNCSSCFSSASTSAPVYSTSPLIIICYKS